MEKVILLKLGHWSEVKNSYIPGFREIISKGKELKEAKVPFQTSKKNQGM